MIEIFKDVYVSQRQHVLSKLQCDMFYFSMDGVCYALTADGVRIYQELSSNQEEADTKMILHCEHALKSSDVGSVVLRSHSGDTDINIVAASLITNDASRVFVDYNTGDNRKVLCLGDLALLRKVL